MNKNIIGGYVLPNQPQPLMVPELNNGWKKIRDSFDKVKSELNELKPELLVIYSTKWLSVIGHQIQARKLAEWTQVDDEWHEYGDIPYKFNFDPEFAKIYSEECKERGLASRTIDYHGFPIDTGSIVALKLINEDLKIPSVIVSSNVYADRAETVVLGKACQSAIEKYGKKTVVIASTMLSNRAHTENIEPKDDKIHSLKDQEWNLKFIEFLNQGRIEDLSQLSRQFHREARVHKVTNFKPFWWLSACMGEHNNYSGNVIEYQPVYGMGGATVSITYDENKIGNLEYDEDSPDTFMGDRNVLDSSNKNNINNSTENNNGLSEDIK